MKEQPAICYNDQADKRDKFVRLTVPAVLASARKQAKHEEYTLGRWMYRAGVFKHDNAWDMLRALHEAARAGKYVKTSPHNCDKTKGAMSTLEHGGDCDQWAAVLLACCKILGFKASLCAFGDDSDPYQHVAIVCNIGRQSAAILDPKGNQTGAGFNEWPPLELKGAWR